jgi:predicted phage terminase large subunit-like protein
MNSITPREYRSILRSDFCAFIERCFSELYPQATFLPNWHIELMAAKLDACRRGEIKRLIITLPPRHFKSMCASVALPAFLLGHNPSAQIICASYGQDLAEKLAKDCRAVMMSQFYQQIFPTRLVQSSVQEIATSIGGFRMATSVGGVLTGRGGDFIIIDDSLKPGEAISTSQRNMPNQWFDNTLLSRLNSQRDGCIIIVQQRVHQDDLVGHVQAQGGWEILNLPAIAEMRETHIIESIYGPTAHVREVGDVLHADRETREVLDRLRRDIGEYNFAGQYQQSPAPLGGGIVQEAWFKQYNDNELPYPFDQIIQSLDTANKPGELNDFSVCTTWGIKDKRIYLLNVFRKKLGYPDLKRAVREQADIYEPSVILIEEHASGVQLIQELIDEGLHQVQRCTPKGDKEMRLRAQTATIENGFVYLPRVAHWLAEYLFELMTFPNSRYKDQADSTSQALGWMKQRKPGDGIFEYTRLEAAKLRPGGSGMFRLSAPVGISNVTTITGRDILVPVDRVIEGSWEEMGPLIAAGFVKL